MLKNSPVYLYYFKKIFYKPTGKDSSFTNQQMAINDFGFASNPAKIGGAIAIFSKLFVLIPGLEFARKDLIPEIHPKTVQTFIWYNFLPLQAISLLFLGAVHRLCCLKISNF